MGKAEEAIAKRRTKAARKRLRKSGNAGFKESIVAAKQRRKAGTRRICEGMCYTLPTPEDPFNDRCQGRRRKNDDSPVAIRNSARYDKMDTQVASSLENGGNGTPEDGTSEESDSPQRHEDNSNSENVQGGKGMYSWIANSSDGAAMVFVLMDGNTPERNQFRFWEACQKGLDVVGTTEDMDVPPMFYVPAAVDILVKKQPQVTSGRKPIILVLVSTQEEALSVRSLCKPLKELLGIQAVSIHPGTSIEHQVEGLEASCAQIMVATPERLCQLLAEKAVSLSSLCLLVAANLSSLIVQGFKDSLSTIKSNVSPTTQVILLSETFTEAAVHITRDYVEEPVSRVGGSLKSTTACITQDISVIVDESKKLPKVLSIIRQHPDASRSVILAKNDRDVRELMEVLSGVEGLEADCLTSDLKSDLSMVVDICEDFSKGSLNLIVAVEDMSNFIDWSSVKLVVNYDCPSSVETYLMLVASMARTSVNGYIYTFCGCSSASVAHELVSVLKECSQTVPSALQLLADAASAVLNNAQIRKPSS